MTAETVPQLRESAPATAPESEPGELEVRCPRCHGLLLTYLVPGALVSIKIQTRCRRCKASYVADLRADGPIVSLTPDRPSA